MSNNILRLRQLSETLDPTGGVCLVNVNGVDFQITVEQLLLGAKNFTDALQQQFRDSIGTLSEDEIKALDQGIRNALNANDIYSAKLSIPTIYSLKGNGSSKLAEPITLKATSLLCFTQFYRPVAFPTTESPVCRFQILDSTGAENTGYDFLPGDIISANIFSRTARLLTKADWSVGTSTFITANTVRIRDDVVAGYVSPYSASNDSVCAFDSTGTLAPIAANQSDNATVPSVSSHPSGQIQITVPKTVLTAAGFTLDAAGIQGWIAANLSKAQLYYQSSQKYYPQFSNFIVMAAGSWTIATTAPTFTSSMDILNLNSKDLSDQKGISQGMLGYNKALGNEYSKRIFAGNYVSLNVGTSTKKKVRVESVFTDLNSSVNPRIVDFNIDGTSVLQRVFPPASFSYTRGLLQSYFRPVYFSDMVLQDIQYRDASTMVNASAAKFVLLKMNPNDNTISTGNSFSAIDYNNNFTPMGGATAGSGNYTYPTISGGQSGSIPIIQFTLPVDYLTERNVNYIDKYEVLKFVSDLFSDSVIWARTVAIQSYAIDPQFFECILPEGNLTVSIEDTTQGFGLNLSVFTEETAPKYELTDYTRQTASVINNSGLALTAALTSLKVKFEPGRVFDSSGLVLKDGYGNLIDCQFADAFHPNPRLKTNIGYHPDGSLAVGEVLFYDDFAAGKEMYYELLAFGTPVNPTIRHDLTGDLTSSDSRYLTFDGYVYNFNMSSGFNLSSITTPAGVTHGIKVYHSPAYASYQTGQFLEAWATYKPTIRVVNSGPVFVDVEVVVYCNTITGFLNQGDLKIRTVYRIMKNGKFTVKVYTSAENQIAVNKLAGTPTRIEMTGFTPAFSSSIATVTGNLTDNKNLGMVIIHNTGDTHRDGTNYGPTRPTDYRFLNTGSAYRLYTGWRYTAQNDYSLLNWPVLKNWTWTKAVYIDVNCSSTDPTTIANMVHNAPCGFLGESGFATVKRRKLLRQIKEIVDGTMDWWYSGKNNSHELGGGDGTSRSFANASMTYDLMKAMVDGTWSYGDAYVNARTYINNNWKSFTDPGTHYTNGDVVLQWASRMVIPVYHWLYKWMVQVNDTAKIAEMQGAIKSYADAILAHYNKNGGVNLSGVATGPGNSNSNATGLVVLALGVYAGQDDANGSYLAAAKKIIATLESDFTLITNILTDGRTDVLANAHWSHYQMFAWNNYFIGCELLGITPNIKMESYVSTMASGLGGFNDIDWNISESRRGNFNSFTFASYPIMAGTDASMMNFLERTLGLWDSEYGAQLGLPRRCFNFDGTQAGSSVTDITFNGTNLSEVLIREFLSKPAGAS